MGGAARVFETPEEIDAEIAAKNAEIEAAWDYDDAEMDEVKMATSTTGRPERRIT